MSYGGGYYPPQEEQLEIAERKGIGNNAAAGNSGGSENRPTCGHPGTTNFGTSVGAIGPDGKITGFSSRCKQVDVAAPGARVLSSVVNGGYGYMDGTSMACPYISGAKAILRQAMLKRGSAVISTAAEWNEWFKMNAVDRGRAGHDFEYGYGVLDFASLLDWLASGKLKFLSIMLMVFAIASTAEAQNVKPLSADVSVVDAVVEDAHFKTTAISIGDQKYQSGTFDLGVESRERKVVLIRVTSTARHINVLVRKTLFETVETVAAGDNVWLAVPDPGTYVVEIDTYDPELGIERAIKTITVEGDPVDEPDPDPEPGDGEFAELAKLAADLARRMNDDPTRQAILVQLQKIDALATNDSVGFDEANRLVGLLIVTAMESRSGPSLKKDWENGFRIPLDLAFARHGIDNKKQLIRAWAAIRKSISQIEMQVVRRPIQNRINWQLAPVNIPRRCSPIGCQPVLRRE